MGARYSDEGFIFIRLIPGMQKGYRIRLHGKEEIFSTEREALARAIEIQKENPKLKVIKRY